MKDPRERLIQYKTNIDIAMSVLDKNGLGDWLADKLVEIGDTVKDDVPLRIRRGAAIRFWTSACAWRIFPKSRRRSRSRIDSRARRSKSTSRCSASRARWRARGAHLGNRQVDELRHRESFPDHRGRSFRIDQPGARQHVGALRSGNKSSRNPYKSRDPGSRQCFDRHRSGRPERHVDPDKFAGVWASAAPMERSRR